MSKNNELILIEIGKRISDRRKNLGFTQEELAEKCDLTAQSISYAESGKRALRADSLKKISSTLGVSADYLLCGDVTKKDLSNITEKLSHLSPQQLSKIETIIDQCIGLCES